MGVKLSHYGKTQTEGVRQQTAMETVYTLQDDQSKRRLTKLQREEFHDLQAYPSLNIMKMIEKKEIRWLEHVIRMADEQCSAILVGKSIGKRPLGRPRHE
jgi:hypothetical protein